MTPEQKVLSILGSELVEYVNIIEPVRRGEADVLYAGDDGVLIYDRPSYTHMLAPAPAYPSAAKRLLELIPERPHMFVAHGGTAMPLAVDKFGLAVELVCRQAALLPDSELPTPTEGFEYRQLDSSYLRQVARLYMHAPPDYIANRIAAGDMYGAFKDGELAGFIGVHDEGAMGMLEVRPEFRRHGIGRGLLCYLSGLLRERGCVPFSQFRLENTASLKLHSQVGFAISRRTIYWMK